MSSHHIVREKQEPALFILNIEHFDTEHLGQLLEWSPTVLVTEDIYNRNELGDLKIDIVIGSSSIYHERINDTKFIIAESSLLNAACDFLIAEHYGAVNIINDLAFNQTDYLAFLDHINLVIYNHDKKIYPVKSGFNKWKAKNQKIMLFADNQYVSTHGLSKIDDDHYLTDKDGFFKLEFSMDSLFIAEDI